jgi:uncharacterized protein (DUF305 family)
MSSVEDKQHITDKSGQDQNHDTIFFSDLTLTHHQCGFEITNAMNERKKVFVRVKARCCAAVV